MITLAIDAMGGDFAPEQTVKGAVEGAKHYGVKVLLVGLPSAINAELAKYDTRGLHLEVVEASESIDMDESPIQALRKKKNASIAVTARLVKEGKAQGMVAAGSTGAAMTAALFNIGRIKGVERPAIGVVLPCYQAPCLLLDGGANADCPESALLQFAQMGKVYIQRVHGIADPKVGFLNIGTEEGKGSMAAKSAYDALKVAATHPEAGFNFVGNIEGRHLFLGGAHVAVADGFSGNIAIKSAEGVLSLFGRWLKEELTATPWQKLVGLLVRPAVQRVKRRLDHEELGGALLMGINGICVIAHGGSSYVAIHNAMRLAKQAVEQDVVTHMTAFTQIASLNSPSPADTGLSPSPV
jgi:glycerol-3-phosphate acyltransferase PlsX